MMYFVGISLLIAANLLLVTSFENKTIFEEADIYNQVLPPLPGFDIPDIEFCGFSTSKPRTEGLEMLNGADMCCQAHKKCEEVIEPLSSYQSLFNPSILPKYNCKCEQDLLNCLQDVNDIASIVFGQAYFGIMGQCFAKDYPSVECVEYQEGRLSRRCIKYKLDETKEKVWQFFDLPFFTIKDE